MGFSLFGSSGSKSSTLSTTTNTQTTSAAFDVTTLGGETNIQQIGSGATVTGLTGKDLQGFYNYAADGMQTLADVAADVAGKGVDAVKDVADSVVDMTGKAFDKSSETTIAALSQIQEAWRRSTTQQVNIQETLEPYVKIMAIIAAVAVMGVVFAGKRK